MHARYLAMPGSDATAPNADRNLLFGILALQMDFLSRDALIAAMQAWAQDKAKPLGQIFLEQGTLGRDAHALLEALVKKHLELHANDTKQSLKALSSAESVREDIRKIADPELNGCLARLSAAHDEVDNSDGSRIHFVRWLGRHRMLLASATAALATAVIALIIGQVASSDRERLAHRQAQQQSYVTDMIVAQRAWEANQVGRVLELLEGQRPKQSTDKELRGWEWYHLERLCHNELRTLEGHSWAVTSVAFSPDGTKLASASDDMTVKIWDAGSGQLLRSLSGHVVRHLPGALRVAFSPDWTHLATTSWDGIVKLWDTASGQELRSLQGGRQWVAFSPDGKWLAAASFDEVRLWDVASGQELHTYKEPPARRFGWFHSITSLAISPDGKRLAVAANDDEVKLLDAASGQVQRTLRGVGGDEGKGPNVVGRARSYFSGVSNLAFSPDGTRLATATYDGFVKLWDLAGGEEPRILKGRGQVLAFSPDGTRLAAAGNQEVTLWDPATGQVLRSLKGQVGSLLRGGRCVTFSRDGTRLAVAGANGTVLVWDGASGQDVRTLLGHTGSVRSLAFSPDGTRLASASEDKTVKLWDLTSEPDLRVPEQPHGFTRWALSPDGTRVAFAGQDGTVTLWDVGSGQKLRAFPNQPGQVQALAFSLDGARLASGRVSGVVAVWDTTNGKSLLTVPGKAGGFHSIAFSPDGTRLAAAAGYTVKLWDTVKGQELQSLRHVTDVNCLAFSPDGMLLASGGSERIVRLWDVVSGLKLFTLEGHTGVVSSVAFSPDGELLASASSDQTVKLWDVRSGQELHTLKGHLRPVSGVAFCPRGSPSRLASADGDEVILWDPATGREVHTLKRQTDRFAGVAFSQDGWRLASGGSDGTIIIWDARPLTADVQIEREATSLVRFLFRKSLSKQQATESLYTNNTISQPVRKKALALVGAHGGSQDEQLAYRLVDRLFATPRIKPEVIEIIRKNGTLSAEVRRKALVLAENWQENFLPINQAAWAVVAKPGADLSAYRRALTHAEYICRLAPQIDIFFDTLAVAQYRVGQYQQAHQTLSRFDDVVMTPYQGYYRPTDLAFQAMTLHQLGRKDRAQETLLRLREMMKEPQWVDNKEARGFLREAEELLKGPAGKRDH